MNQSINNPSGLRTGMQQPSTYNPSFPQGNIQPLISFSNF